MNYQLHYYRLVDRARTRTLVGYIEKHHVVPKCLGGSNSPDNIVSLTAEEHYIAHQLLVKMYPSVRGLIAATIKMATQCSNNKAYGWLRKKHSEVMKKQKLFLGRTHSEETKLKMSITHTGSKRRVKWEHIKRRGVPLSDQHKASISSANRGRIISEKWRAKDK